MSSLLALMGGGEKPMQRGVIAISDGTGSATITSVDTTKSKLARLGVSGGMTGANAHIVLTNATTITATGNATAVSWELSESY